MAAVDKIYVDNNNCLSFTKFGKSHKAIIRKVNKWNLPKGLEIEILESHYLSSFKIITK